MDTLAGGQLVKETIYKKYGKDYYREIGRKGGKAEHFSPRGFAAMTPEKHKAASEKGGKISRRNKSE